MSNHMHKRSWSLDDQDYLQFMFADGWAPSWNTAEERNYDLDRQEHMPDQQGVNSLDSQQHSFHHMPWMNLVDRSTYDSLPPAGYEHHQSPMIDGSGYTTASSISSTVSIPMDTQAWPYLQTAIPQTQQSSVSDAASRVRPLPQPLEPALPTASQSTPWSANSPRALIRQPRPPSPRTQGMSQYGTRNNDGSWSCRYDTCNSHIRFRRKCDLRKHYLRHFTRYYCSRSDCDESEGRGNGFSSRKDCTRHEQKHDPRIPCDWETCDRFFSRRDNMRDHVKRTHLRPKPRRRASVE